MPQNCGSQDGFSSVPGRPLTDPFRGLNRRTPDQSTSYPTYLDFRKPKSIVTRLAAYLVARQFKLTRADDAEQNWGEVVSGNYSSAALHLSGCAPVRQLGSYRPIGASAQRRSWQDRNHTSDDARRHLTRRHALTVLASWDLRAQFSRRQVAPSNRCRLCMTPFRQVDRIGASSA